MDFILSYVIDNEWQEYSFYTELVKCGHCWSKCSKNFPAK